MNNRALLHSLCMLAALASPLAHSQSPPPVQLAELADLSLEQLTRITVSSASRREEPLTEAPASLYVISQDDIRRSGATTLPDVLRLAPNLHVARADNNQYVVSARGFSDILNNKLLVLIDGRTVYTPLFSGVFWEAQDVFLPDVERIEVISGPGASLWGANAVNGVINVITRKAGESQGTLLRAGGGDQEWVAALRHGGTLPGNGHFRAHVKVLDRDGFRADNRDLNDDSRIVSGGLRADWAGADGATTLQADAYRGDVEAAPKRDYSGASVLARHQRKLASGAALSIQAYYDRTARRHENSFDDKLETFDVEGSHTSRPLERHLLIVGGGHRHARDEVVNTATQAFLPPDRDLRWTNVFLQDEIAIDPSLAFIVGLKAERNPYTGVEWLPNARFSWHPSRDTLVWGALSRAVRAPSRIDREVFFPGQPPYLLTGSDAFESEVARVVELGYRTQATSAISFSATLFHHDYPNLRSLGLVDGRPAFVNDNEGRVTGIESWGAWRVNPAWRIAGGFVVQEYSFGTKEGRTDLAALSGLRNTPERWALLRASWSPTADTDIDITARHVGSFGTVVPAYTTADLRFAWRPLSALELALSVRNAFDRDHIEWQNRGANERSFLLHLRWRI